LNYAWQLFSVSLAAQLMIAPLSLYYFHDFPVLFLITSLVAIPATFIVILLAALSLILSSETFSFLSLEPILDWFVNSFISLLEIFTINEGFIIKGLFPNSLEIGLYYCALFSIVYYFTKRNKLALLTFVVSFSALFYYQYNINKDISGSSVIIYAHSSEIIIDVINAGSLLHIKEQAKSKSKYDWIANNRRIKNGVNYQQEIEIKAVNQVIEIQDFKLGIVYDESFFQSHEFESIDYLLLKRPIEYSCINEHSKVIDYTDSHNHLFINNKQTIIKI
jgi:competence protein ComEC